MKKDIVDFFSLQRHIFGICPHSGQFFRLSECKIYRKERPIYDWMDKIETESNRLDKVEERLDTKRNEMQEAARVKGRHEANKHIRKIDRVFAPRRINPDDAKVLFHPIDFVVFNGMKNGEKLKNIVFLDRETKSSEHRQLQRSIEKTIDRGNYEWITLRVEDDGNIKEE